ncbi:30S ribosomal protein S16 [Buchnera aphidicola]|uniref:Small ribosomal subunit protein bS16 n=1 Tax=Buchnera aphidicola (Cinara strobi) TaxID=1921549 RepID=A0A3B1DWH8_9GAMM|nr:30S ribosomal protein S16 [Buchnera aphidicola]VAX76653.1 30S ribosomal protein S16 [Buchnera aphidicola (Cinara strobi)]
MIKIKLARHGVKKKPFYKIVISDVRSPRDGKFIERVGYFNPFAQKKEIRVHFYDDRVKYWLKRGAKTSNTVKNLLLAYQKKK